MNLKPNVITFCLVFLVHCTHRHTLSIPLLRAIISPIITLKSVSARWLLLRTYVNTHNTARKYDRGCFCFQLYHVYTHTAHTDVIQNFGTCMIEGEILLGWSFMTLATNQSYFKMYSIITLLMCVWEYGPYPYTKTSAMILRWFYVLVHW